ncbi:TetR/AcrR family transcriptional regulator [Melissospora conviva]|uniref:TetR/AcrR family transcriptional regulator n=1 Tax=Melissospora conviva TaxID=3388432 RepID=UPI003B75FC24
MPRQRDLREQQERLSAATWAVLAEQGVTGLTLRAVAERAGCTTGLVLHTFGDKRALLMHARRLLHERSRARYETAATGAGSPAAALRAVLHQSACLSDDGRDEARIWVGFLAAALADPELAALHTGYNRAFLQRVGRLAGDCRPEWNDERRAEVARALVALVEGLNCLAAADSETYSGAAQRQAIDTTVARLLA